MYLRAYFHNRLQLRQNFATANKVVEASVQVDSINGGTSIFRLVSIPSAVNEGDVMTVHDAFGIRVYQGVVLRLLANEVECEQIEGLFNDDWIYKRNTNLTLEEDLAKSIRDDFINSSDPIVKETFKDFQIKILSQTSGTLPKKESNYVKNFMDHLHYMFNTFDIKVDITIFLDDKTAPMITIGKVDAEKIVFGNNSKVIKNVSPITQVYETNKLVIYNEDGTIHRGTFYGSRNGITEDKNELTRFNVVKTNYAFSDESLSLIKAQNLRNEMFNHKVELDLVYKNKLYDFFRFQMGQQFDIFINNSYFKTILTGFEYDISENSNLEIIHLVFGKVRLRLTQL